MEVKERPVFQRRRSRKAARPAWLAAAEAVRTREEAVAQYVRTGDVLDLGVVDSRRAHEAAQQRIERHAGALHAFIHGLNPAVLGVDLDREGVEMLAQRGYRVLHADVECMDLGQRFDTIVAGEIIEHLMNPGTALRCWRRHLEPEGRLVLSTCNPFYVVQFQKIVKYDDVQVHEEHTCWFDPRTLGRLLELSGYQVERLCWLHRHLSHNWLKSWPKWFRKYFSPSFLMVARPAGPAR